MINKYVSDTVVVLMLMFFSFFFFLFSFHCFTLVFVFFRIFRVPFQRLNDVSMMYIVCFKPMNK